MIIDLIFGILLLVIAVAWVVAVTLDVSNHYLDPVVLGVSLFLLTVVVWSGILLILPNKAECNHEVVYVESFEPAEIIEE